MNKSTPKASAINKLSATSAALAALLAFSVTARAADASVGKAMFDKTCASCHSIEAGVNKVGPTLFDIVGRPIASAQGYDYSAKMRAVAKDWKIWDEKHLNAYLTNPRGVLHGVKMFFSVPDAADRADVIAYLNTLK